LLQIEPDSQGAARQVALRPLQDAPIPGHEQSSYHVGQVDYKGNTVGERWVKEMVREKGLEPQRFGCEFDPCNG